MLDFRGNGEYLIEVNLSCWFTEIQPKRLSDGFLVGIDPIQKLVQSFFSLHKRGGSPSDGRG